MADAGGLQLAAPTALRVALRALGRQSRHVEPNGGSHRLRHQFLIWGLTLYKKTCTKQV